MKHLERHPISKIATASIVLLLGYLKDFQRFAQRIGFTNSSILVTSIITLAYVYDCKRNIYYTPIDIDEILGSVDNCIFSFLNRLTT